MTNAEEMLLEDAIKTAITAEKRRRNDRVTFIVFSVVTLVIGVMLGVALGGAIFG